MCLRTVFIVVWTNERENKSGGRNEWDEGEEGEAAFEDLVRIRR